MGSAVDEVQKRPPGGYVLIEYFPFILIPEHALLILGSDQ